MFTTPNHIRLSPISKSTSCISSSLVQSRQIPYFYPGANVRFRIVESLVSLFLKCLSTWIVNMLLNCCNIILILSPRSLHFFLKPRQPGIKPPKMSSRGTMIISLNKCHNHYKHKRTHNSVKPGALIPIEELMPTQGYKQVRPMGHLSL